MVYIEEYTEIKKHAKKMTTKQINDVLLKLLKSYREEPDPEKKKDLRDKLLAVCGKIIEMNASKLLFATEMFEWNDLYNEGIIIAIKAIENYDFNNKVGSGFVTYLTRALNYSLKRKINYKDRRIVVSECTLLKEAKKRKENIHNDEEPVSLVRALNESDFMGMSSDDTEQINQGVLHNVLEEVMECLSTKEKYIVQQHIGFDDTPITFQKLADEFETNPSAIFSIYNNALKKLKKALAHEGCDSISDFF